MLRGEREQQSRRVGRTMRASFRMTDDDWMLLASLTEPTHLDHLSMYLAQRCLHLYKAGYLYTDPEGWVTLSLHGKQQLARRQRT